MTRLVCLAGLPVDKESGKLYALTQTKEWKNHARYMDQIWNVFQQTAPRVVAFSQTELEDINARCPYTVLSVWGA